MRVRARNPRSQRFPGPADGRSARGRPQHETGDLRSLLADLYQVVKCTQKALEYKGHEAEFDAYSRTLKRYILAFHALIYKDVRDIGDLSDLAQRRLLSGAEVHMLEAARGPRSVVVSGWMYRLVTKMEQTDVLFCEVKVIQVQLTGRLYEIRRHTTNLFAHVNKQYVSPRADRRRYPRSRPGHDAGAARAP